MSGKDGTPAPKTRKYEEVSLSPSPIIERIMSTAKIDYIQELVKEMVDARMDLVDEKLLSQEKEMKALKTENKMLKEKVIKIESQSRRCNLRFYGFPERRHENPADCKRLVLRMLNQAGFKLQDIAIERAHRLGPPKSQNNRPIIARFFHFGERELVFQRSSIISQRCQITVTEDFPEEIDARRKV